MDIRKYKVDGGGFELSGFDPGDTGKFGSAGDAKKFTAKNTEKIAKYQSKLYAEGKTALLIIFQAMDAAGKDSAIKHVMSGINPQGVGVYSFKQPSAKELAHDYLWRAAKVLPERGKIGIFNRSYYEDVLVVKVHKLYEKQNMPEYCKTDEIIANRYRQIRDFEKYLWENGTVILKFYLNLSKETQRKRFLERIDNKDKNWKFSEADLRERNFWDDYQGAYQAAIAATSTENNPWYVVPADNKWYTHAVVSEALLQALKKINPEYPVISPYQEGVLAECKKQLAKEEPPAK
ncbi:MAG: polyphosphate kinase 2 family protein [Oscillospiraceae bacterium]|nr:polyphosphate kinase 2 family protein [Oscillospiraceae bacterium]